MSKMLALLVAVLLSISTRGAVADVAPKPDAGLYAPLFLDGDAPVGALSVATDLPGVKAWEFKELLFMRVGSGAKSGTEMIGWCQSFRGQNPTEVVYVSCTSFALVGSSADGTRDLRQIGLVAKPATAPACRRRLKLMMLASQT